MTTLVLDIDDRAVPNGNAALTRDIQADEPAKAPVAAARSASRIRSLDGLRGVAALIVVFHHILLTVPAMAIAYQFTPPHHNHDLRDLWIYTPLHTFWDGPEAVMIFFVLSGYVLSGPYAAGKKGGWRPYYPQRLLRLYLPVWGALVLALILVTVVARHAVPGASFWMENHATFPHGVRQALGNATLLTKTGWLDSPLWSLRLEVAFSIALPLAVWAGRVWRRLWWAKVAVCVLAIIVGWYVHSAFVEFFPAFGLGVFLVFEQDRIRSVTSRFTSIHWAAAITVSLLALSAYWDLYGLGLPSVAPIGQGIAALAACGILIAMRDCAAIRSFGESPVNQWLGKRSFSLYLIHEPIVVTVAFALGGKPNVGLLAAIAVPLALAGSDLFYRAVERPGHMLSLAVGRKVKQAFG